MVAYAAGLLAAVFPYMVYSQQPKLNDFNIKFNTVVDDGDVTTYLYRIDEFFLVKESQNRICYTENQTTFSIARIPIASIVDIYVDQFAGQYGVFVDIDKTGIDKKFDLKVDCLGREWPQRPRVSTLILTGSDENLADNLSTLIREEFGVE